MRTSSSHHISAILQALRTLYPDAQCALDHSHPLELLVATILSAQCTDRQVNSVTPPLFRRCRSAADYATIPLPELETLIHSTGFFRNKAKSIRSMAAHLIECHGGHVPQTLAELIALPGVGRKTANVVLYNSFGISEGIVVDTHVSRLSQRLGLTCHTTPEKIEHDLMRKIPCTDWGISSHWLITHGRLHCHARNPNCPHCPLASLCPKKCPFLRKIKFKGT